MNKVLQKVNTFVKRDYKEISGKVNAFAKRVYKEISEDDVLPEYDIDNIENKEDLEELRKAQNYVRDLLESVDPTYDVKTKNKNKNKENKIKENKIKENKIKESEKEAINNKKLQKTEENKDIGRKELER